MAWQVKEDKTPEAEGTPVTIMCPEAPLFKSKVQVSPFFERVKSDHTVSFHQV